MALTVLGNGDFALIGSPRWIPGRLNELDALELVYQGAYNKLATFRNTLTKWMASTIDSNMFLESFPDDGDPVKPKVTLRYIGCKGGTLPAVVESQGQSIATVSSTDGELALSVLYRSPHTQFSWIGNSNTNTNASFSNAQPITIIERRIGGHVPGVFTLRAQTVLAAATDEQRDEILAFQTSYKALIVAYFNRTFPEQEQLTNFEAVPLVPGHYWQCTSVTAKVLTAD